MYGPNHLSSIESRMNPEWFHSSPKQADCDRANIFCKYTPHIKNVLTGSHFLFLFVLFERVYRVIHPGKYHKYQDIRIEPLYAALAYTIEVGGLYVPYMFPTQQKKQDRERNREKKSQIGNCYMGVLNASWG